MKNAILVSADQHWRVVMEGTLLGRGWSVACVESLSKGDVPSPKDVQAILIDSVSIPVVAINEWLESAAAKTKVPVVIVPSLSSADDFADVIDQESAPQKNSSRVGITFWGVRGSIPSPGPSTAFYGGNTSCVELTADGETIILDAGSGIRSLGEKLIAEAKGKPLDMHLLITHTHWDHIQGLPFFRPAYVPTNHLRVVGYEAVRHNLADVLAMQMDSSYFPISMADMPGHPEVEEVGERFNCGPVRVEAFFTNHPGKCAGFRFETSAGAVVYISDNELNHDGQATHLPRETVEHLRERLMSTMGGCKLLIHDAQYTREEYKNRVGWGHSCIEDITELAAQSEVERLVLFHHDPTRDDAGVNQLLKKARDIAKAHGGSLQVDAAREGMSIWL
jgi:phosphoribosyl 1,2-cyclic phosphodiesterase